MILLLLQDCRSVKTENPINEFRNLADSVGFVGMQQCRSCHEDIYQSYMKTGMGQSFDFASRTRSAASFGQNNSVYDSTLDLHYKPFLKGDSIFIKEYRLLGGDTVHKRIEKVDYIIGSGHHTNSHMCSFNGYLYQAPITFYTQDGRWDLAPGFDNDNNSRFSRTIELECMSCHNGYPEINEEAFNNYETIARGIDCERCHGAGELHVKEKLAGKFIDTAKFIDYSIVNPAKLDKQAQMSLCQRCHLQGVSVLKEGKTFFDFKPSMNLSDIMEVFIPRYEGERENFIMASHADRLKQSNCYKSSEMTCISCHNPHKSVRLTGTNVFNAKCGKCHNSGNETCSLEINVRITTNDNNCVDCHMPSSG
ncbi:MAG: pilus assembly protein TadD, partial [Chitinophagales bacterium]|nr:pilus assembly protein TadD [Chitinophagales bacterium]